MHGCKGLTLFIGGALFGSAGIKLHAELLDGLSIGVSMIRDTSSKAFSKLKTEQKIMKKSLGFEALFLKTRWIDILR